MVKKEKKMVKTIKLSSCTNVLVKLFKAVNDFVYTCFVSFIVNLQDCCVGNSRNMNKSNTLVSWDYLTTSKFQLYMMLKKLNEVY